MKPTEADIQAELDRHGLGFVVVEMMDGIGHPVYCEVESEYLHCKVLFRFESRDVKVTDTESWDYIKYGFDSKFQANDEVLCYMPDKQKILSMCESIVRLITGEQVEQTLEEKVREIKFHELEYEEITEECVKLVSGGLRYWIYSDKVGLQHLSDDSDRPSFRPLDEYCKTAFGFGEKFQAIAALLTEQPEQTLEEAVRGILKPCGKLTVSYIRDDEVSLSSPVHQYWITAESVTYSTGDRGEIHSSVTEYARNGIYKSEFKAIAALLSTRSTKPSYSDLEQRVDELEKGAIRYEERIVTHAGTIKTLEKDVERLERENASLLDKFGPIDQAEQQVAEVETRFQKLAKRAERIAHICLELNEAIL